MRKGSTCIISGLVKEKIIKRKVRFIEEIGYVRYNNKLYIVQKTGEYCLYKNNPKIKRDIYSVVKEATLV